jgi:hypothetical protein
VYDTTANPPQVQPDEVFFHRFYTLQTVRTRREAARKAKHAKKEAADAGEENDGANARDDALDDADLSDGDVDGFLEGQASHGPFCHVARHPGS